MVLVLTDHPLFLHIGSERDLRESISTEAEQNGGLVFVMVPVDQWNDMVEKLKHYEWLENLCRIDREMDEDPDKNIPWNEVKKDLIEKGLLEASGAEA